MLGSEPTLKMLFVKMVVQINFDMELDHILKTLFSLKKNFFFSKKAERIRQKESCIIKGQPLTIEGSIHYYYIDRG